MEEFFGPKYGYQLTVLEEYYHVLRQWNPGKMTKIKYFLSSLRHPIHPYRNNKYEKAAKKFAKGNIDGYRKCLANGP